MRVVLVAGLLLAVGLAGCSSGGGFEPTAAFPDADQRWSGQMGEEDREYRASLVPGNATWHLSATSDEGFDVEVYVRGNLVDGDLDYEETPFSVRSMTWRPFAPDLTAEAGVWVECEHACAFTFARDQEGTIPPVRGLPLRYRDADARFVGDLDADFGSHDFEVPEGVTSVRFRMSVYAPDDWFHFTLTDADGDTADKLRFPALSMDDLEVLLSDDGDGLPAGTWNLLVDCDAECSYAAGLDW